MGFRLGLLSVWSDRYCTFAVDCPLCWYLSLQSLLPKRVKLRLFNFKILSLVPLPQTVKTTQNLLNVIYLRKKIAVLFELSYVLVFCLITGWMLDLNGKTLKINILTNKKNNWNCFVKSPLLFQHRFNKIFCWHNPIMCH